MAKTVSAGAPPQERDPTRDASKAEGTPTTGGRRREPAETAERSPRASTTDSDRDRGRLADAKYLMSGPTDDEELPSEPEPETPTEGEEADSTLPEESAEESTESAEAQDSESTEEAAEAAEDAEQVDEAVTAEAAAEKANAEDNEDPEDLTDEQLRYVSKKTRKQLNRVFESRAKARKELETVKPRSDILGQIEADLTEAGINLPTLKARMQFEKDLSKMTPQQKAAKFREIANQWDPAGGVQTPVTLDDDLSTVASADLLPAEDVQELQRLRAARKAKQPGSTTQQPDPRSTPQFLAPDAPWTADEEAVGKKALDALDVAYAKRYPADWKKLAPVASAELAKEVARIKAMTGVKPRPENWEKLAKEITERVIKRSKQPLKTPPRSLGSSRPGVAPKRDYQTREELAASLQKGLV